jgi:hypothetical protein
MRRCHALGFLRQCLSIESSSWADARGREDNDFDVRPMGHPFHPKSGTSTGNPTGSAFAAHNFQLLRSSPLGDNRFHRNWLPAPAQHLFRFCGVL